MVMIRRYAHNFDCRDHLEDCIRIRNIMREFFDDYTLTNAYTDWSSYSESYCAGWMLLPEDDKEILEVLTIEDS